MEKNWVLRRVSFNLWYYELPLREIWASIPFWFVFSWSVFTFHVGERVLVLIIPWELPAPIDCSKGDVQGQGCCPRECPLGHSPDPWPLGAGTARGGDWTSGQISVPSRYLKEEERSGTCSVNIWEKSQGDEGCEGVAFTHWASPAQRVTLTGIFWGLCVIITLVLRKWRGQFHHLYSFSRAWQWFQSPSRDLLCYTSG